MRSNERMKSSTILNPSPDRELLRLSREFWIDEMARVSQLLQGLSGMTYVHVAVYTHMPIIAI
jgi:hypothetical protein